MASHASATSAVVQIDHVVALANAWQTGAATWDPPTRVAYANDPQVLLAVSGPTNMAKGDRDAASGYHGGAMAKGFKLHAVVSRDGKIPRLCTLPLNCNEMPVARRMLDDGLLCPNARVLADANYDAHVLHKHVHARGARLICRLRGRARHPPCSARAPCR